MKIIKTCLLDGQEVELESENITLELNNSGRGFVTVQTEQDCQGKPIVLEVGEYDNYHRWFDGIVEQEQNAQNGYKRLFIRERTTLFERPLNCALRHVTLADVCQWLEENTKLEINIPQAAYTNEPIPLFTHAGSGYQLLANIGRQFQIPHYMWQQNTDGSVYIGSWQDSDYPDNEWHIDSDSTLSQFSNAITIPVNAAIRPGALVNGKRIIKVNLQGDHYELTWADLDDAGKPLQKSPERRAIEKEFPELAGGYHLARYAKIVSIADPSQSGDIADPFRPKYAVDVQLLDENNQDDKSVPVFPAVPLPVTSTASQGGDFAFPEIGTIVEIGFINGRSDKPVIRNFYPQGKTLPQVGIGETLRQQRSEVFERVDASGNKRTQVLGNIDEITASNKSIGVGGNASESIKEHKILVVKGNIDFSADGQVIISGQNILLQADTITLDGEVEITKSLRVAQSISASQSISVGSGFSATGSQVSINGSLTALTMTAENVQANTIAGGSVTSGGVSIEHSLNHLANSNKKMVSELTRIVNEINSAFDSVNSKIYALEKAIDNKPQEDTPQSDAMINGGSSVNKPSAL